MCRRWQNRSDAERKVDSLHSTCKFLVSRLSIAAGLQGNRRQSNTTQFIRHQWRAIPELCTHRERGRSAYQVFLDIQPPSHCVAHTCVSYHRHDEPTLVWNEGESVLSHYAVKEVNCIVWVSATDQVTIHFLDKRRKSPLFETNSYEIAWSLSTFDARILRWKWSEPAQCSAIEGSRDQCQKLVFS